MFEPTRPTSIGRPAAGARRRYRSRMDAVWVMLLLSCGAAFWAGATHPGADWLPGRGLVHVATAVATLFILVGVPCHYTLHERELRIQSGLYIRGIAYSEILSAAPARSLEWAPAWSRDRLVLQCVHGRRISISPVRQAEFLAELMRRLPQVPPPGPHDGGAASSRW